MEQKSGVSGYEVSLSNSKGKVLQQKDVTTASISFRYVYVQTVCNKGKSKGTSGALYHWTTKGSSYGYLTN